MKNEIDFPTADEIVARCRDFVSNGGEIVARDFGDGLTCGCPMTIMGLDPEESFSVWGFISGFDFGPSDPDAPLQHLGAEVRRRLEAEGLMADQ